MMDYDLTILGAGWAGFNAALAARKNNLKVALIEKEKIGGTCLNSGCIPTKSFLQSAKTILHLRKSGVFGIKSGNFEIDFPAVISRKNSVIDKLAAGMKFMTAKLGIDLIQEQARILSPEAVSAGKREITSRYILIATGAQPQPLPGLNYDGTRIISSDGMLQLSEVPRKLLIVGGGVIGCEFASIFATFGSEVTICEKLPRLLPSEEQEASLKLTSSFSRKNIKVMTATGVSELNLSDFDTILVAIGRKPQIDGLFASELMLKHDNGRIIADDCLRSSVNGIYAAGDALSRVQLAHVAAYEGRVAVHNMLNPEDPFRTDYSPVPNVIFTDPEIARAGITEEAAIKAGLEYTVKKSYFLANGMARIIDETDGFIKIIIDPRSSLILGATIVGPQASEIVNIISTAMTNRLTAENITNAFLAHPSLSEMIAETLR